MTNNDPRGPIRGRLAGLRRWLGRWLPGATRDGEATVSEYPASARREEGDGSMGSAALDDLLDRWEEGEEIDIVRLRAEQPELAERFEERAAKLRKMAGVFLTPVLASSGNGRDGSDEDPPAGVGAASSFIGLSFYKKGGLGVLYRATQTELRREVIVKFMRPHMARDPRHRVQFKREAEVPARLAHPGIVPIYGIGKDAADRPCYAMKLIEGRSLDEEIAAFHATGGAAGDPSRHPEALRALIQRFKSVCVAIAFAHRRGILHRDIKPANVVVGPFDETVVVDWGLAKSFDLALWNGPPQGEAPAEPGDDPDPTLGIGTLGFMSPEQMGSAPRPPDFAAEKDASEQTQGDPPRLAPTSDVFSLGATLYVLLTGKRPFVGSSSSEIRKKVRAGEFTKPTRIHSWIPANLEAICLKALEVQPGNRYLSAAALADDVEKWLADEPVSARPEPWTDRAHRVAKKHRTIVSVTSIALVFGLVSWIVWRMDRDARLNESDRLVGRALTTAQTLQGEGERANLDAVDARSAWNRALSAADGAKSLLAARPPRRAVAKDVMKTYDVIAKAAADAHERVRLAEVARRLVADLEEARLKRATVKDNRFDSAPMLTAYAAAFRKAGIDFRTESAMEIVAQLKSMHDLERIAAALDDWGLREGDKMLVNVLTSVAQAIDPERNPLRIAIRKSDRSALLAMARDPAARKMATNTACLLARLLEDLGCQDDAIALLTAVRLDSSPDFWINHDLGALLSGQEKSASAGDAVRFLSVAAALKPDSPGVLINLGVALRAQGKLDEAAAAFREAIRLKPDYAEAHSNLGDALRPQGKLDEAITACREAIRLKPGLAEAHSGLGAALYDQGRLDEAAAAFREAIRLKPDYAGAHSNLGSVLHAQDRLDEAAAAHREAIRLEPGVAMNHTNLGITLQAQGKHDEAVAACREAIRLKPDLAEAHSGLGAALGAQGKHDEAVAACREAIRLKPGLAEAHSNLGAAFQAQGKLDEAVAACREAIRLKPGLPTSHFCLGVVLMARNRLDEAVAAYREAIRIRPNAKTYSNLGNALHAQDRLDEAAAAHREAIRLKPGLAEPHFNLGLVLQAQGKHDEAIAACREAIRLKPGLAEAHSGLGLALRARNRLDEAVAAYREAIRIRPNAKTYSNLGNALHAQDRLDEAAAAHREAIRLEPGIAESHNNLGATLRAQGKHDEAVAAFREAIRLKPDYAGAYHNLGITLQDQGQFAEAVAAHRETIRIRPSLAEAHNSLGNALKAQDKFAEAVAAYREAIRIRPDYAEPYCNLGQALRLQCRFKEALVELRKGHALGSRQPGWRVPSARWVAECEAAVALEARLPKLLRGEDNPKGNTERLNLAQLCYDMKWYAASARFWGEALANDPELGNDRQAQHRYNAACSAALASSDQSKDDPRPDEAAKARLRAQALSCLKAELSAWKEVLITAKPSEQASVAAALARWKTDTDLAWVRDTPVLEKLPEDEKKAWQALWIEVNASLEKARK